MNQRERERERERESAFRSECGCACICERQYKGSAMAHGPITTFSRRDGRAGGVHGAWLTRCAHTRARARSLAANSPGIIFDLLQSPSEQVIIICLRNSA